MLFGRSAARKRMEAVCRQLLEVTRDRGEWDWEEETNAALTKLDSEHFGSVMGALEATFPHSWDQLDVGAGPERVRHVAGMWGGLMAGQRLFVLDAEGDPVVYALWMPWSDHMTASLRVSCVAFEDAAAKKGARVFLRACMGLGAAT